LLKRVVTGDESWIFEYDPLTKRQSLERKRAFEWKSALSPRPKKARMFECVEEWQRRLEKCIRAQGDYFEGNML